MDQKAIPPHAEAGGAPGSDFALADRIALYRLLACFLDAAPGERELALAAALDGDGHLSSGGLAGLAQAARMTTPAQAAGDWHRIFIGVGHGELFPYASYYLSGSLHDQALVDLRSDMQRLGISRAAGVAEPEDHIATLLEIMAGLLAGELPAGDCEAQAFFRRHIVSWGERFFSDLAGRFEAPFHAALGRVGAAFIASERELMAEGV